MSRARFIVLLAPVLLACGTPVAAQDTAPLSPLPTATVADIAAPAVAYAPAGRLDPPDPPTTVAWLFTSAHPEVERWHALALDAGWPRSQLPWLFCVIQRESGGDPHASGDHGASVGLVQIRWPSHSWWLPRSSAMRQTLTARS